MSRPDFQWFKDKDFKPVYSDCRDIGFIVSLEENILSNPSLDKDSKTISEINCTVNNFRAIEDALFVFRRVYNMVKEEL